MIKLSRDFTEKIRFIIDQCVPPIIRDLRWFMILPLRFVFKSKANIFLDFKQKANQLSRKQFEDIYKIIGTEEWRITDLNSGSIEKILKSIKGKTVLEVGCGKGYLAKKLADKYLITAADIAIDEHLKKISPMIKLKAANIEALPFKNMSFDTVISTHTLEHVQNIYTAISELRRVTKKRLIIVVPKQRPYQYTFDLHLHFFPYIFSLMMVMNDGKKRRSVCNEIGRDLFYIEDF